MSGLSGAILLIFPTERQCPAIQGRTSRASGQGRLLPRSGAGSDERNRGAISQAMDEYSDAAMC